MDEECSTQGAPSGVAVGAVQVQRDHDLKSYIGTKVLLAKPMSEKVWMAIKLVEPVMGEILRDGYLVIYDNGYQTWSPKDVFDTHYRELTHEEKIVAMY